MFEARFDFDEFGDWLASHGIDCPIRADDGGHVCELEAVEGAAVTAEAVRVAIADTEVELDEWRSEKGFYVYGYTWGLHFENQDNANAVFTRLPDASFEEVLAPPS